MDKDKNPKNPLNRMGAKPLVRAFCFPRAHILFKAINLKNRFRGNIIQRIPEFFVCML